MTVVERSGHPGKLAVHSYHYTHDQSGKTWLLKDTYNVPLQKEEDLQLWKGVAIPAKF